MSGVTCVTRRGARVISRRMDYAVREELGNFEEPFRTAHTIGNRFDDNGTPPAALTPAPNTAEIVEQTQKRASTSTGRAH